MMTHKKTHQKINTKNLVKAMNKPDVHRYQFLSCVLYPCYAKRDTETYCTRALIINTFSRTYTMNGRGVHHTIS